jgi:hypothetical protein
MVTIHNPMIARDGGMAFRSTMETNEGNVGFEVAMGSESTEVILQLHPKYKEVLKHVWGFAFMVRDGKLFLRKYKNGKVIEDMPIDSF